MGAKTCLVAQSQGDARRILADCPDVQESATTSLVASLFPGLRFGAPRATDLSHTYLSDKSVVAGCFPGLCIVIAAEVAIDRPSELPSRFIAEKGTTILHAMHSVVDWLAFAVWKDGILVRSVSVAPDSGVIEDIGERLAFEAPYWNGEHPAVDPEEEPAGYPLPFHPLELGEEALREFFGFQLEGYVDAMLLEPERIPMLCFDDPDKIATSVRGGKAWWKFW